MLAYQGTARQLVAAIKFDNRRAAVRWAGAAMAALAAESPSGVVTWAPTSPRRARARGYDQARLIARSVAKSLHRPCRAVLRRTSAGHQTGHARSARRDGPSFRANGRLREPVLLVDEVMTTGATLQAAAAALRAAGAIHVTSVVLAATPLKLADGRAENHGE